jgi:predicted ABC-type ATPase
MEKRHDTHEPGLTLETFASEFLPDFVKCREFLNADLIAAGLSPFAFFRLYQSQCDRWSLYDASRLTPALIAWEESGTMTIIDSDLFHQIQRRAGG